MKPDEVVLCSACLADIKEEEVQKCWTCGMDGLGNCCIGTDDHRCTAVDDPNAHLGASE